MSERSWMYKSQTNKSEAAFNLFMKAFLQTTKGIYLYVDKLNLM